MRVRVQLALSLLLIGPTLVVPVEKWHHHADGDHEHDHCALCIAAATTVPNSQPATALPALDFAYLLVSEPHAPTSVFRPAPVQARAPPARFST
jgi:hypothetical protein